MFIGVRTRSKLTRAEDYPLYIQSTRQAKQLECQFQSLLQMMELNYRTFLPVPELNNVNIILLYWDHENIGIEDVFCTEEMKSKNVEEGETITICVTKRKNRTKAKRFIRKYEAPCMLLVIGKTDIVKKRSLAGYFQCQSAVDTFCQSIGRLLQRYVYSFLVSYTNALSIVLEVQEKISSDKKYGSEQNVKTQFQQNGIQGPLTNEGT